MSGYHFVPVQGTGGTAPAPPSPPVIAGTPRELVRAKIRESIRDVEAAVQERAAYQQQLQAAEQRVDAARQQMADARTSAQKGAAGQELGLASANLAMLRVQGDRTVGVHISQPPVMPADLIPPQAVDIAFGFFFMLAAIIIGWPLARAFGRRLERHGGASVTADPAVAGQLQRIEQAVEAMSIEIERISESQRFMAKLQNGGATERAAIGTAGERH